MISKTIVIARLTVTRKDDHRTIVEIHADATFSRFYRFHQQQGLRRSTKRFIRSASRNESLPVINAHLYQPGLDVIARKLESLFKQSNPVVSVKIRIIKKRLYKKMINASPEQLGLVKVNGTIKPPVRTLYPRLIGKAIPMAKFAKLVDLEGVRP